MSLFNKDHESHKSLDSILVGFVESCIFFNPFVMFYDSVMKQVRNSYDYSWDSAGCNLNRHDTMTNSLRCAITYLEILQ